MCLCRLAHYVKELKIKDFFSGRAFPFKTSFELLETASGHGRNKLYQVPQICTMETSRLRFRDVLTLHSATSRKVAGSIPNSVTVIFC
jgi:hypothetical protein